MNIKKYRDIAIFLFGELWLNEIKNVNRYDDLYKYSINMRNKTIYLFLTFVYLYTTLNTIKVYFLLSIHG